MPDYIIRQTPAANVTVISSPNQIVIQQPQPVTVCLSTGGTSYVLLPATNATLGGVKVGANLTVDANGVLAAVGGMTQIANVTYGVSQIPNLLGNNNARYVAGLRANRTTATANNNTILLESYSGLLYNPTTIAVSVPLAGYTQTYSDPASPYGKEQYEIFGATLRYLSTDQSGNYVFNAGFNVAPFGGAKLFFTDFIADVSTEMQVDSTGVTIFTNGIVTVNGDEVVTLEVAKTLFAPLTFKGS